jgi:hypothetical protein
MKNQWLTIRWIADPNQLWVICSLQWLIESIEAKSCFQVIPEMLREALFELENHIPYSSDNSGQELKCSHVYETINNNTKEF